MQILKSLSLRGPNVWGRDPGREVWVESSAPDSPPETPARRHHHETPPTPESVSPAAREAEDLSRVMGGLLAQAGVPMTRSELRPTADPSVFRLFVACDEEDVSHRALEAAIRMLGEAPGAESDVWADVAAALRSAYQNATLGPSTRSIVRAAQERGIPTVRLSEGSLVQLGHGARQRRVLAAETDATSAVAQEIACDKELSRILLRAAGVPVPEGGEAADDRAAWDLACAIGLPVVVKPVDGNQGRGVATNLTSRESVVTAFEEARSVSRSGRVTVERFAPGADHRVLVVGSRVIAASRREPPKVVGDGAATIALLIDRVNADPRRGEDHATSLSKIPLDAVSLSVLAEQGLSPDTVPESGRVVLIRRNANLSTGGTAEDVTEEVLPEVAARCLQAARAVGLDVAGIDVVAPDLRRPLEDQGGVIVEVNAAPGLRMHLEPSHGAPRPVGRAIVDLMFAPGESGRIPIVAVTGVNGKTTVTRLLAHLAREAGETVGLTCTDGLFIDGRRLDAGDCSGPASARAVLQNPAVTFAALETARGGILRAGLGFDACTVAVVTNIGEGDHLGLSDVHTPADLARVKGVIVENVRPDGTAVLNAADPLVAAMAERCSGRVLFFAREEGHPILVAHRSRGGRVVCSREGQIVLSDGPQLHVLMPLADVPFTHGGLVGFQVENALAAAAAGWAAGLPLRALRDGLRSFDPGSGGAPGRFNLMRVRGATVVVDYGHNTSSLRALVEAVASIPASRRHVVYTAAGDRRDEDMRAQGRLLGDHFDTVYLYEERYRRGRPAGEICGLLRAGMTGTPLSRQVEEHHAYFDAVDSALAATGPGDLLVIQPDDVEGTLDRLRLLTRDAPRGYTTQHSTSPSPDHPGCD